VGCPLSLGWEEGKKQSKREMQEKKKKEEAEWETSSGSRPEMKENVSSIEREKEEKE